MSWPENSKTHNAEAQANKGRTLDRLGKTIYSNSTLDTVVKELFQNAFDAVKAAQHRGAITHGTIDITSDNSALIITVKDNGIGMTADTVRKALFTLGGSDKADLPLNRRSGGSGRGKDVLVFGTEAIGVSTIRDGVKTRVTTTPERIKSGTFQLLEQATSEPNGTTVSVRLPAHVRYHPGDPPAPLYIPVSARTITPLDALFTGKDTEVTYNGEPVAPRPKFEKRSTLGFDWGKVDVYLEPRKEKSSKQQVLAAGVFQFTETFKVRGAHSPAPVDVALDVYPNVAPTDPNYPFDDQRGSWRTTVNKDIEVLRHYVDRMIENAVARETVEKFYNVRVMQRVDPRHPMPVGDEPWRSVRLRPADGAAVSVKERFSADMSDVPADKPLLHSNLNLDLPAEMNSALKKLNEKPTAAEMFSELGSVAVTFTQTVSRLPGYEGLGKYRSGISLDKDYAGVNIAIPFDGIFLNPYHKGLFRSLQSPKGVAGAMLHVLKHEAVHEKVRAHNAAFAFELSRLDGVLHDSGDHDRLLDALNTVVQRHWMTYLVGSEMYERSSKANIGKSVDGQGFAGDHSGTGEGNPARRDRTLPSRGSEPGIRPGLAGVTDDTGQTRPRADAERTHTAESEIVAQIPADVRRQALLEYQRNRPPGAEGPPKTLPVKAHDTDRGL
jgi:hypothetical protein